MAQRTAPAHSGPPTPPVDRPPVLRDADVIVRASGLQLPGELAVPANPQGLVVFADDTGGSRHSPRNHYIASALHGAGFATLLFDLLTPDEERDRSPALDVPMLAHRLEAATAWAHSRHELHRLPLGYLGASTGAAAALWAAAEPESRVRAVVSYAGRPDLAERRLAEVGAPTLLIVAALDPVNLDHNRHARHRFAEHCRLDIVPGATHRFDEPGALATVAQLARDWFTQHLPQTSRSQTSSERF